MFRYVLERFLVSAGALLMIATTTFFLMKAVPGDPLLQEKAIPEVVKQNLRRHYGLDRPILEQYGTYMKRMFLEGDFGMSFKQENRSVNDIIKEHFGVSAFLGLVALLGALIFGVSLGITAALNRGKWPESVVMMIAVLGVSIPSFCLAYILQEVLAIQLNILPVGGWGTVETFILPAFSLGMIVMAAMARLMRSSMLEVVQQDYIRTARAKGLSKWQVVVKHQIRNAILPVMIYFGPLFAAITTGTFVIESIFGIPGLGQFFVNSVHELDYTVIMGLTVFYAGFSIFIIFVNDLSYSLIDPRIRISR